MTVLAFVAAVSMVIFMTAGVRGDWSFVLALRSIKLATLVLVGTAIAVSTVLFQTISTNRILTPSIMGFDALYALIQTALAFFLGSGGIVTLDPMLVFGLEVVLMVSLSLILYRWLFSDEIRSLHLLILIGIVFGLLFRSLATLMQRLIDPNEFMVLQDKLFATFNAPSLQLLLVSAAVLVVVLVAVWRITDVFDVMALGRDASIGLGVEYRKMVLLTLAVISVLVSVSTALVGPVTFFGLLVANLAYQLFDTYRHRVLLPAAALLGVILLVVGQFVLERIFSFQTALGIVIEFLGGVVFIVLVLRGNVR